MANKKTNNEVKYAFDENDNFVEVKASSEAKVKQGKKNRASGGRFELKVRKDSEAKGWIVDKWSNNVEFNIEPQGISNQIIPDEVVVGKLIPAKRKYNPFSKALSIGTGFPDFICFMKIANNSPYTDPISGKECIRPTYEIIGVEAKSNGYLDKEEREKCKWLLESNIFSKILIAKKGIKRGEIVYDEFQN